VDNKLDLLKERVVVLGKRLASLEEKMDEVIPVIEAYVARFGYAMGKNCKSCGASLGSAPKVPVKCPRCENATGWGGEE
jgi:hypothetical protein